VQSQDRFDAAYDLIALARIERAGMWRGELAGVVVEVLTVAFTCGARIALSGATPC
jgi:hypothetical protein